MKTLIFLLIALLAFVSISPAQGKRPIGGKPVKTTTPVNAAKKPLPGQSVNAGMTLEDAKAQAEAARKTIEDAARTRLGVEKEVPLTDVFFDGPNYGKVTTSKYFQSGAESRDIDWASFESVEAKPIDALIWVTFKFANKFVDVDYWVEAGAITRETKREFTSFTIALPPSEAGRVKDLETAAATLARIVKDKGNVVFSPRSGNPLGKPAKNSASETPSFKETERYIDSALSAADYSKGLFCNGHYYRYRRAYVNSDRDTAYLSSDYEYELNSAVSGRTAPQGLKFKINLKNVEAIKIVTGGGWEGCRVYGLGFVEKGKSENPALHIPLWEMPDAANPLNSLKNEKIYKALNHLRKLIGAPEPIEFK